MQIYPINLNNFIVYKILKSNAMIVYNQ